MKEDTLLNAFWLKLAENLRVIARDDERRIRLQYLSTYTILAFVSLYMSIVNVITAKYLLLASTLFFAVLCVANIVIANLGEKGLRISTHLFTVELLLLIVFFIVTGTPEGFSAIWAAMIPASSLLLFKRKRGSLISGIMFCILVFFFWFPAGRELLQYNYTESFMLRFPLLYFAFFLLAFFLESVRQATFDNYLFLNSHDVLTGALNRKGFDECTSALLSRNDADYTVGFMIADLDLFKMVNDKYGHLAGDEILKETVKRLNTACGAQICRWGGEEFSAMFYGGISPALGEKIRCAFDAPFILPNGEKITQHISIGAVNAVIQDAVTADELCLAADQCLYEAKNTGRNRVVIKDYKKIINNT